MANTQWIFPKHNADHEMVRDFELSIIKAITGVHAKDMDIPFGVIRFFVFSPDKNMSIDADYETFQKWRAAFDFLSHEQNIAPDKIGLVAFDWWTQYEGRTKSMAPFRLMVMAAANDFHSKDFDNLKRVTLFQTRLSDNVLDTRILKTPRDVTRA